MDEGIKTSLDGIAEAVFGEYFRSAVSLSSLKALGAPEFIINNQSGIVTRKQEIVWGEVRSRGISIAPEALATYIIARMAPLYRDLEAAAQGAEQELSSGEIEAGSLQESSLYYMVNRANGFRELIERSLRGEPPI